MKKMLLLLTLVLAAPFVNAASSSIYDAMQMFTKGEKKHKNECFEFEKNFMVAKFDLMKRQHDEMFDWKSKEIQRLQTEGFSEQMLRDCLAEKVAMCDRHMDEWKQLCDNHHAKGEAMYRNGKNMIKAFKNQYLMGQDGSYSRGYESNPSENENFLERTWNDLTEGY